MRSKRSLTFVVVWCVMSAAICGQITEWTPGEMIKYKRVSSSVLSPDGEWIAYTLSEPRMEGEDSEFLTHVWIVSWDGKENTQLTRGEESCTAPRFSPDGSSVSFLSSRGETENRQIWVIRMAGGEASQVTDAPSGVNSYRWSPDGTRIAYTMNDPESDEEKKAKDEKRDMRVMDADPKYSRLYVISSDADDTAQKLTSNNLHVGNFDWSPDRKQIVFDHQSIPGYNEWPTTDISIVNVSDKSVRSLVSWAGADMSPLFSPDGNTIAFASDGGAVSWARDFHVYLVAAVGGEPKKLANTPSRYFRSLTGWSDDGRKVIVSEPDRTSYRFLEVPVNGGSPSVLTTGSGNFSALSVSHERNRMAFVHERPESSPNVYVSPSTSFKPTQITDMNPDFDQLEMSKTVAITWTSSDGTEIEGLLTTPHHYKEGKKVPFILNIHGGPSGVFTENFTGRSSVYPIQAWASEGYAVLRPNPRGSSGYSKEFRFANQADWGEGDYEDVMAGVDKVIEMGIAHPDSLCVTGWSYGGYMTSRIVTKTNRFKAATMGAGVTNLVSMTNTTDILSFTPYHMGGELWDRYEVYIRHSPIFRVHEVTTPTQIVHGEQDVRVPVSQGYEFYQALKRRGVRTEMIVYPRMPHGLREPKFIQDCGERIIEWFNSHLGRSD